jgi:hypothetical protein
MITKYICVITIINIENSSSEPAGAACAKHAAPDTNRLAGFHGI